MNDKIKQLAKQATIRKFDGTGTDMGKLVFDEQKFAELIVKECRDIVGKTRDQAIEDEWNVDEAMSTAMFNIEEHFGIEE